MQQKKYNKESIGHLLRVDLVIQFKDVHNTVLDAL